MFFSTEVSNLSNLNGSSYPNDLLRRLAQHRSGKVRSTKPRLPIQLIYFEECQTPE